MDKQKEKKKRRRHVKRHGHVYEHFCVQFKKKTPAETQVNRFFTCSRECNKQLLLAKAEYELQHP